MASILVTHFSATGATVRAAKAVAEELGADLAEVRSASPYTAADLNWFDQHSRSTREANDRGARPARGREVWGSRCG